MEMSDDIFEKKQEFSFFIGISIIVHLVGLLIVLLVLPSPTKAKLQKSTVRVAIKYAQKPRIALPAAVKKESLPKPVAKKKPAEAPPKKKAESPKKNPPKPEVTQPLKKPTLPKETVLTKPIYVPKKIKPTQPSNLKAKPTLKKTAQKALQPPVKAPKLSIARPKPKLPKPTLKKPKPQLLKPKLSTKVAAVPLPKKLPKAKLPKNNLSVPKAPPLTKKPKKTDPKKEKSAVTKTASMEKKPAKSEAVELPIGSSEEPTSKKADSPAGSKSAKKAVTAAPPPDLKVKAAPSLSAKKVALPGSSFLLKQQQEKYNALMAIAVKQSLYAPARYQSLNVRIEVVIGKDGELLSYMLQRSSGVEAFDLTALNAVKTAQFPSLPEELAKNPPYVVPLVISP